MNESKQNETIGRVVFKNEPKLSEHEVDQVFNDRRVSLLPQVRNFISAHDRFKGKEVTVTFSSKGVSSLVSIIETPDERLVLKVPLRIMFSEGEGQFLKVWERAGVRVPHVIEEGTMGEHSYVLMEYIDAEILSEKYDNEQLVEKGIITEMGRILRVMHTPEAEGYGRVVEGKAEYPKFEDWLESDDIKDRIEYAKKHKFLGDKLELLLPATFKALTDQAAKDNKSSYCHDDFGASNIFATDPITIFDPNTRFNNRYIDLGRTVAITVSTGKYDKVVGQLIKGYFEEEAYNHKALLASVLLNSCMKFPYWDKTKKFKRIKNVQDYLLKNADLI